MFKFLKLKTPKEKSEYNKEKIINKNVKLINKSYSMEIKSMISKGILYTNHKMALLPFTYGNVNSFREESVQKGLIKLRDKYKNKGIIFEITWTGCQNSYIGISIEFI